MNSEEVEGKCPFTVDLRKNVDCGENFGMGE